MTEQEAILHRLDNLEQGMTDLLQSLDYMSQRIDKVAEDAESHTDRMIESTTRDLGYDIDQVKSEVNGLSRELESVKRGY